MLGRWEICDRRSVAPDLSPRRNSELPQQGSGLRQPGTYEEGQLMGKRSEISTVGRHTRRSRRSARAVAVANPKRLAATLALGATVCLGASAAAAAAPRLFGPSVLAAVTHHNVDYRATGLRAADGYALRLVRPATSHSPRCVAYLAAPRRAAGTAYFRGSIGDSIFCVDSPHKQQPLARGSYVVEVCVPVSRLGPCRSSASIARRRVHLQS